MKPLPGRGGLLGYKCGVGSEVLTFFLRDIRELSAASAVFLSVEACDND